MRDEVLENDIGEILKSNLTEDKKAHLIACLRADAEIPKITNHAEYLHYKEQYLSQRHELDIDDHTSPAAIWTNALGGRLAEYQGNLLY